MLTSLRPSLSNKYLARAFALLAVLLVSGSAVAQSGWEILHGEDSGPYQLSDVGGHWRTDHSLVDDEYTRDGFVVNGVFIGTTPLGIAPEKLSDGGWKYRPMDATPVPRTSGGGPLTQRQAVDTLIYGQRLRLVGLRVATTDGPVHWLSLDSVRALYCPQVQGRCVYTVDKFVIPGNGSLFRIDQDYIYRVEAMQSTCVDALRDLPLFTFVRIFTRAFDERLAHVDMQALGHDNDYSVSEYWGYGAIPYLTQIRSGRSRYYTSLDSPQPQELYQGQALVDFLHLCDSVGPLVKAFLTRQELRRWKRTGESRPRMKLAISSEGEVLEMGFSSPVSMLSILTQSRYVELNKRLRALRFPAFNREPCRWPRAYRCILVSFSVLP